MPKCQTFNYLNFPSQVTEFIMVSFEGEYYLVCDGGTIADFSISPRLFFPTNRHKYFVSESLSKNLNKPLVRRRSSDQESAFGSDSDSGLLTFFGWFFAGFKYFIFLDCFHSHFFFSLRFRRSTN